MRLLFFQGKIQVRVKSQAELNAIQNNEDIKSDNKAIKVQMKKMAYDALIKDGVKMKKLKKEDLK